MAHADVGNLALLEVAVANHVTATQVHRLHKWPGGRVNLCNIVLGLRDLRVMGCDPSVDLGMLILQRLNQKTLIHTKLNCRGTVCDWSPNQCIWYLMPRQVAGSDHGFDAAF